MHRGLCGDLLSDRLGGELVQDQVLLDNVKEEAAHEGFDRWPKMQTIQKQINQSLINMDASLFSARWLKEQTE